MAKVSNVVEFDDKEIKDILIENARKLTVIDVGSATCNMEISTGQTHPEEGVVKKAVVTFHGWASGAGGSG